MSFGSGDFGGFHYTQSFPWENLRQTSAMQDSFIRDAAAARRRGYNEGQSYQDAAYKPYRDIGSTFANAMLGFMKNPQESAGYKFLKDEQLNALENSAAARGGVYSGNALRALQDRAVGLADTYRGQEFNRLMSGLGMGHGFDQTYADRSTDLSTGKGFSDAQMYGDFSNYINKHEDAGLDLIKNWSTLSGWTGQGGGFKQNTQSKDTNANKPGSTSSGPTNFSSVNSMYNYPMYGISMGQTDYPGGNAGWFAEDQGGWFE